MASPRQTVSFLKKRFSEIGIWPNTKHGQNFLIDLNLIEFLVRAADIQKTDIVLEVGTGTGSMTAMLAERAHTVITVEIDEQLSQLAQEEMLDVENVVFLQQDALKNKNHMHQNVLDEIRKHVLAEPNRGFKLVANLPYNVATPIISNLLLTDPFPDSMTVTIQKELADRVVAEPSTKDYGALSVWIQSLCFSAVLRELPPTVFWPRPKVTSAILQIVSDRNRRSQIADLPFFHQFCRKLFLHRRKFLRGALIGSYKGEFTKADIDEIMETMKLGANARAEELDIETIQALSEQIRRRLSHE